MNTYNLKESDRQKCEVWTRVMGYHRPVSQWNNGKQMEFKERVFFTEGACNGNNNTNHSEQSLNRG